MAMLMLFAALVAVGIFMVGYGVGRSRASEYDAIKKKEYKAMTEALSQSQDSNRLYVSENSQYRSALRDIAAGRGGAAEITASTVLNMVENNY